MEQETENKLGKWRPVLRICLIVAGVFLCLVIATGCVYRWMATRALKKEIANTERDPVTGIMKGFEPIALGTGRRGVLLIHGYIGSPKDFGELPQRLADAGYRVRVPLLPGHGTKPQDMLKADAEDWLEGARTAYHELAAECDWVGIVGFSMGGMMTIRLAADEDERPPDALVLACPFLGVTYRWYAVLSPGAWNKIVSPFIPYVMRGDTFVQVNRREVAPVIVSYRVVPTHAATVLLDAAAEVRKTVTHLPTDRILLLYAPGDGAAAPQRILQMADKWGIPAASRMAIENSNHLIFWDYNREVAIEAVMRHLNAFKNRAQEH